MSFYQDTIRKRFVPNMPSGLKNIVLTQAASSEIFYEKT